MAFPSAASRGGDNPDAGGVELGALAEGARERPGAVGLDGGQELERGRPVVLDRRHPLALQPVARMTSEARWPAIAIRRRKRAGGTHLGLEAGRGRGADDRAGVRVED